MTESDRDFATPMMQQYLQLKAQYQDCVLWFRLGDFYEMFLDDAKIGAEVLDITLTSRTRGKDGRIPMAGVPYHAADNYLHKLIDAGHKVAICEQVTEPNGKGLVEREVVRIVTPGTVLDEKNLHRKEHNFLMSVHWTPRELGVALTDLSTGELLSGQLPLTESTQFAQVLADIIARFEPRECIVSPAIFAQHAVMTELQNFRSLHIFAFDGWPQKRHKQQDFAVTALLNYLEQTQKMAVTHLRPVQPLFSTNHLQLDRSTIANLELLTTLRERNQHDSLVAVLDETHTAMGGRLLKHWILHPLAQKAAIETRQHLIGFFLDHPELCQTLSEHFPQITDIERLLARLSLRAGNPKDLRQLADSLSQVMKITQLLHPHHLPHYTEQLNTLTEPLAQVITEINAKLLPDPAFDPRQGGVIADGQHPRLDALRNTVRTSRTWIQKLEQTERQRTGISTLKIRFNQVFGFYIEVSKANLTHIPNDYLRKQTLVNAERFITPALKEHEEIILTAEDELNRIEYELFLELIRNVLTQLAPMQHAAQLIAELDCLHSLATVAELYHYTKPKITDDGVIEIIGGRHPVVEQLLHDKPFIPNDVTLNHGDHQLLLLTGPNMAGKSVLMRQTAVIVLLAHLGSYVPAQRATIALTDQIFVRSGAADVITAGLSTFMVEMTETAYILQHATEKSLIIMDEIGRGTSTYDGISIAWAVAEFLAKNHHVGAKTLFATHYHELQALAENFPEKIQNYHLAIANHDDRPVFLYKLKKGGASHSFGVAVAQMAGLPAEVVHRAKELLKELETRHVVEHHATENTESKTSAELELRQKLSELSIENLTPLAALNMLATWKKSLEL